VIVAASKNDSGERKDGPTGMFMFFDPRSSVHLAVMHGPFNHPADLIVGDSLGFSQKFTFVLVIILRLAQAT